LLLQRLDKLFPRLGDLASACFELLFGISAGLASLTGARFAFVPVKRSLRPCVRLFAPLRDKITSSAPGLAPMLVVTAGGLGLPVQGE
jgi:hypothetical protein